MIDVRELETLCRRWVDCELLFVDTEFVRTRTFYARLGLIQVADADGVFLVDAIKVLDLGPFRSVLESDRCRKVFHSCGEDMGVFLHEFGLLPENVFDTQIFFVQ